MEVRRNREIVKSFQDRLPLTYLYEEKPGKNPALNAALAHLEGDLALLTDDDVFPRPNWLASMRNAADSHTAYAVFGGTVRPRWEVAPPDWIVEWVPAGPVFTLTPPSMPEGPVAPGSVYGPNMAVRSEIFRQGFSFDSTTDLRGQYAMGSETEFVIRLARMDIPLGTFAMQRRASDPRFPIESVWIFRVRSVRAWSLSLTHTGSAAHIDVAGKPRHLFRQSSCRRRYS